MADIQKIAEEIGSLTLLEARDLVKALEETLGIKAEAIINPRTDPGVSRMCADLGLAREKLGYQPRFSLSEGLRLTLERDPRFNKKELMARS